MIQNMLLIDADSHYYEPADCCTRYIDPQFADRTVKLVGDELYVAGRRLHYLSVNPMVSVPPPGAFEAFFTDGKSNDQLLQAGRLDPREHSEFQHAQSRLTRLDEQSIDATLLLPSVGVCFDYFMKDDAPLLNATVRAFNKWLLEDWGYGEDRRLFGAPVISLSDVDGAVAEIERVIALGARFAVMQCGPANGRSPADPVFDPFWARCQEAGITVVFHVGYDGFADFYSALWSEDPIVPLGRYSPFQWLTSAGERPIADTLAALVLHNLFGRFPELRVMSVENGSRWAAPLLTDMDKAIKKGRLGTQIGGKLVDQPSEIFKEHVYVQPFYEDDVAGLVKAIGANRVLFGSDYPHPEGLSDPKSFVRTVAGLDDDEVRQIMGGNIAQLMGLTPH